MRIEKTTASGATKTGTRNTRSGVREDVPSYCLFVARTSAAFAAELSVEGVERLGFGSELIDVAFDELTREYGVHRLERHHLVVEYGT